MSIRYEVVLVPEPVFAAQAYRARQIICGQYGSWAAEMFMVHVAVADFFQCSDSAVHSVDGGLAKIAMESSRRLHPLRMVHDGAATFPGVNGHIFLDFSVPPGAGAAEGQDHWRALHRLHGDVIALLRQTPGVVPDWRSAGPNYRPHLSLMQYAKLPPAVFEDAVQFARAVVGPVPRTTEAWKLMLVRFESNAAGDNWDDGRWAADLRWNLLSSYSL